MDDFPEDLAIRVRGVGKTYRLGVINRRTFRDELVYRWLRLRGRDPKDSMGRLGGRELADAGLFHALDDVSFDIRKGETVGLIGRNGAGKSTMLKILARITTPTTGEAWIRGRVGSLLEVGTGFHPELTGRENIYLNGTILGMTKQEIDAKFDEIVDFSEIGEFLDTPVKRYSSGMYVRLAFSVASSLDCDILLLDEVLAVGDAAFQKKCLVRMKEIAASGRTILFVSHSMSNVQAICSRCILFQHGKILQDGPAASAIRSYMADLAPRNPAYVRSSAKSVPLAFKGDSKKTSRPGDPAVEIHGFSIFLDLQSGKWKSCFGYRFPGGQAGAAGHSSAEWISPRVVLSFRSKRVKDGRPLFVLDSACTRDAFPRRMPPEGMVSAELDAAVQFPAGEYIVGVRLLQSNLPVLDEPRAASFVVPDSACPPFWRRNPVQSGVLHVRHEWHADADSCPKAE